MVLPVDEPELVDSFDGEDTLCDVESSDILGECIIFDEHRHEVATRQELHDQVQSLGILK